MTPAEILTTRKALGMTQAQLAEALELGKGGRRIVRAWEKGEYTPSGPVRVALRLMQLNRLSREMGELEEERAASMSEARRSGNFEKVNVIQAKIGELYDRIKHARCNFDNCMWLARPPSRTPPEPDDQILVFHPFRTPQKPDPDDDQRRG